MTFPENAPSANPVFYRTYSRSTNGIESWDDVCDRTIEGIAELGKLTEAESALLREQQQKLTALPSGRWLWVGGTPWILDPKNFYGAYNCLQGDTLVTTKELGAQRIKDLSGKTVHVVNEARAWVPVKFFAAGVQPLTELTLKRASSNGGGGSVKKISATLGHNWKLADGSLKTTEELLAGDRIPFVTAQRPEITDDSVYLRGLQHGVVYGDGSVQGSSASDRRRYKVRLCGEKAELLQFFEGDHRVLYCPSYKGDPLVMMTPRLHSDFTEDGNLKALPATNDLAYLLGFWRGLMATDGSTKATAGFSAHIYGTLETCLWLEAIAPSLGIENGTMHCMYEAGDISNYGTRNQALYSVQFCVGSLTAQDFVRVQQRNKFEARKSTEFWWKVIDVEPLEVEEEVFCCEEPQTHTFTLTGGLLTGNCSSTVVDSWEAFGHMMNLAMQGCGTGADLAYRHITKLPAITTAIKIVKITEIGTFPKNLRSEITRLDSEDERDRPNLHRLVVGDSRQGWVSAYQILLELSSSGAKEVELIIDLRNVRPKGERLKGFGGVANPAKLPGLFTRCAEILGGAIGRKLTAEQCCLLIDEAALVVVAGSIRRSAGMRQFDESTPLLKENLWVEGEDGKWSIDPKRDALRMANHTRVFHRKPTKEECISSVKSQYYSGEGAIQWAGEAEKRAQGKGRYGLNPCVTADTWVHTENGPRQVKDLIGRQQKVFVHGDLIYTTKEGFFHSGTKEVFKLSTVEGYELRLTANHEVIRITGSAHSKAKQAKWTEARNLAPGDRILLHNHRNATPWKGMDAEISYLQELFDVRAEVRDDRVVLPLEGSTAMLGVQRSLARLGIISTLLMSQGELEIAGDNLFWFQKIIDFRDSVNARKLSLAIINREGLKLEDFTATVASVEPDGVEDVYDCTVPEESCFDANGIVAHNCGEIIGENFMCNLSEIHLNLIDPLDFEAQRDAFTAGAIAVSALLNHKFDQERYAKSREEDPIVGVSFTGLFDFFVNLFGAEWLKWWEAGRPESWIPEGDTIQVRMLEKFSALNDHNLAAAFRDIEAQYLEYWKTIVEDVIKEYCDRHQLKAPNRTTVVQPAGTKSLLTGASPGWHPPKAQQFIRRITMGAHDPVALACIDFGYNIIPSQEAKDETGNLLDDPFDPRVDTWLVEIPTKVCWADIPSVQDIDISKFSALAQFDFYMQVQTNYTTHNTSGTLELREPEIEALGTRIYEAIANDEGYISAAILGRFDDIKTYPRLPFEPITVEEYELMHSQVLSRRKVSDFHAALTSRASAAQMEDLAQGPAGCDGDKCLIGDVSKPQENQ